MIAFREEHGLFIRRRLCPGARAAVSNSATDFRPARDFAAAVGVYDLNCRQVGISDCYGEIFLKASLCIPVKI
jgi:hypothetical protein